MSGSLCRAQVFFSGVSSVFGLGLLFEDYGVYERTMMKGGGGFMMTIITTQLLVVG